MRIAPRQVTFAPGPPADYKVEAAKVRPDVGLGLQAYLTQNPSHLLVAGALARATLNAGYVTGPPIQLGANLKLQPVVTGAPTTADARPKDEARLPAFPDAVARASQVAELLDAFQGPVEEFAKTHAQLDTPLDILGVVTATPRAWNVITQPGPKNKTELFLATAQLGVWAAKVAADFVPGMHAAKPALVWTGVLLKTGDQVHAVIVKPRPEAGARAQK